MFRRRSTTKAKLEPEVCVLLRRMTRYPGDVLDGVVVVDFASPADVLTLEVRLHGDERATIGGLLVTDKNPEARKTLYYEQFITLRGVDHDAIEQRRNLLGRRRTVVSQEAMLRKASTSQASPTNGGGASSPELQSTENSLADFTPSVINGSLAGSVQLAQGTYSYPFKVTLPDNIPPSRELHRAREGTTVLRYRATVTLILASGKVYSAETPFRVDPLPVQLQRWYQLHADEQHGGDSTDADDAAMGELNSTAGGDAAAASSRAGLMSRLMSSAGTISTDAADKERDVTCQRRIKHYRQFPESQLAAERAEYEQRRSTKDEAKAKGGDDEKNGPTSPQAPNEMMAEEKTRAKPKQPKTYRERCAKADAADNRSLDGKGDSEGADNDDTSDDEVHAFGGAEGSSGAATPPPPAAQPSGSSSAAAAASSNRNLAASASMDVAAVAKDKKKDKKKKHHRSKDNGGEGEKEATATSSSAMVDKNVEQLAFTPPEEELAAPPAHLTVRHSVDATNAEAPPSNKKSERRKSRDKKRNTEEAVEDKSQGTQAHKRHGRFAPPPWNQEFSINLRGGFLRSGKVKVKLSLRSPLVSVGYGKVMVKLLVDNSDGSGNITRVKYSLITRCYIRTKTEVYNYHVDTVETLSDVSIEKGTIVAVPEVEVPVPRTTPLTLLTEGMGTMTFLNVRLYVGTALKTFSKSVETEVVLVTGQDTNNNSRRLLSWTCFYRRRNNEDTRDIVVRPPTLNLSEQNARVRVVQASDLARRNSATLGGAEADASSMAPSAVDRSVLLGRNSRRMAKEAPSMDARRLAAVLNYDEAIFVPPIDDDDGPPGAVRHVDPMSMLNPFAAPSGMMSSSLPAIDEEEEEEREEGSASEREERR